MMRGEVMSWEELERQTTATLAQALRRLGLRPRRKKAWAMDALKLYAAAYPHRAAEVVEALRAENRWRS